MIKRVATDELRVGMYIHDLNCGWMAHPFALSRFALASDADIVRIRAAGIREVEIDTVRGLDASHAPTRREAALLNEMAISRLAVCANDDTKSSCHEGEGAVIVQAEEETPRARQLQAQAAAAVQAVMRDAKHGKALNLGAVEPVVANMTASILRNSSAMLGLVSIKHKDDYTFQHSVAVSALLVAFAQHEGLDAETVQQIGLGGLLHDIGKMRVPDRILNKPGRYNDDEFSVMQRHAEYGHAILSASGQVGDVPLAIALQHHERMDGSGYPYALKSAQIDRVAQMAAIVDIYDAITSDRVYHDALAPAEALRQLMAWSQHHLSPYFVQSFIRCVGIYPVGTLVRLESGRLALVIEHNAKDLLKPRVKVIFDTKQNSYVAPKMLDLSRSMGHGGADAIVAHESPRKWHIDLDYFR
jgi:putative nucleotidyltransferase with HDIG domain